MERLRLTPRPGWQAKVEALGFDFHTFDGETYWDESAAYLFTSAEIDAIDDVTVELERLCLEAVDKAIREDRFAAFGIGPAAADLVRESWQRQDRNLIGRFDLCVRPDAVPKLYEYNADTPTALLEAAVVQWHWLQDCYPDADQFNSIHEKLIDAWKRFGLPAAPIHFTCVGGHAEDEGNIGYLRDTAMQAGFNTRWLAVEDIGWDGRRFVDMGKADITTLVKLYPWEWLMADAFGAHIGASGVRMIEPAWKMLLANKALLALLWEMFPDHPNLLPASLDPAAITGPVVAKPLLGREGASIQAMNRAARAQPGEYGAEGFVYQAACPLPDFGGVYPVVGSWVIASAPAGIGIREDGDPITRNTSRFVPHFFR